MFELSRYVFEQLRTGEEFILYRGRSKDDESQLLVLSPTAVYPAPETQKRLEHEYSLREELDTTWAVWPIAIARHWDRTVLLLTDPGGVPLDQLLGQPLDLAFSLRLAISVSTALGQLHQRRSIHKDIKPANILVNPANGRCWLTGFGITSRLPRERQSPEPPEIIAGTLAYMAPEQTGRMNRSIDSRSDLYSLGVTLYEVLTGCLPFTASDPMEWVHCHIARQPVPPAERLMSIPACVSAIVIKLLAKTAEERYQTAAGVERDLRRCLTQWEAGRSIEKFPLGEHDTPNRLQIPEKLYGRTREIETLLTAFDRVVRSGATELVLVSGYSGIGRSSVVNELQKVLVLPRGLFAAGKFDQYKRDIPYATLAQAFQNLVRPLLGKSDSELSGWRDAFLEALGPNGELMVDIVPELKLIIGGQPPVPELSPQDAQRRFQLVFRRFIDVFARPEHPLALFLDDLQWLGNVADLTMLSIVLGVEEEQVHVALWPSVRHELVDRLASAYRFVHDRVQEAAYSLIPEESCAGVHLRIGRLLATHIPAENREEAIFDIVSQLNRGAALITSPKERVQLADLNLVAGKRAKASTRDRLDQSVEVGLNYLRKVGINWTARLTKEEVDREYVGMSAHLESRSIEQMAELPRMSDPQSCATIEVLTELAYFTDLELFSLVPCRIATVSFNNGNTNGSVYAYALLGVLVRTRFGNHAGGFRFGKLALKPANESGLDRFRARVHLNFAYAVNPWNRHIRTGRPLLRSGLTAADQTGDLTFAGFLYYCLITDLLASGDPLDEVQREAETGLEFVSRARFGLVVDILTGHLGLIRALRNLTVELGSFNDGEFDESLFQEHLERDPRLANPTCIYWIRKLQAHYFAGDYDAAVSAASKAEPLLWTSPASFELADYHFYAGLARAALVGTKPNCERDRHLQALAAHHRQLETWADNCSENFENRAALVSAEIARIEGRALDAMDLYEQAIRSARANGFVHNEALAYELAARFYAARRFDKIAHLYLREARYGYLRWGATGKVHQLEELYPPLREEVPAAATMSTIGTSVGNLDFAALIKVSQTVSGEIVLEKLIDTLMRTAVEHAGAERGLLILARGPEQRIEAEAKTSGDAISVHLRHASVIEPALPESIVQYVMRTQEEVILDDASAQNPFSGDSYIRRHNARSILCLTLVNQAKLIGVLYLENNLAPRVFTPARIAVLKLLASQAAISLENTRLYRDLEEREAKIRRLVDANIIGILILNLEGQIIEANEAFLHMVQYTREDLVSGRVRWKDLTPPEWRDRDEQAVAELKATGTVRLLEKEYFRKDGSRVPVLIGAAIFEGSGNEGVAFVLDLSEQKRAEEASQRAQAELAHVSRVMTVGELTASIAHQINQPLSAMVANADTGLRWLGEDSPDLEETNQAMRRIVRDGKRASAVVARMRALFKKAPSANEPVDINDVFQEVLTLSQGEIQRNRVSLQTRYASDLPFVLGDRIQLQQVILNLVLNAIQAMSEIIEGPRELQVSSEKVSARHGGLRPENDDQSGLLSAEWTGVLVTVRDSGPGLDPQLVDRLFEPFYTTKPQGLGMGLTISRSIIEAHGGRLWANANAPRGAVFRFTLPI